MSTGKKWVSSRNPSQERSFEDSYDKNVTRSQDVCQDLVARIMVKGKPKCSFLSKACKRQLSLGVKQREFC